MPVNGHGQEKFTVQGQNFAYSDSDTGGGFNYSTRRGGPVRNGLPVRITYATVWGERNIIVKLDVGHAPNSKLNTEALRQSR